MQRHRKFFLQVPGIVVNSSMEEVKSRWNMVYKVCIN